MKLIIEVDDLDAEQLVQLQKSVKHRQYDFHVELKWLWPVGPPTLIRSMTDRTTVTGIELPRKGKK